MFKKFAFDVDGTLINKKLELKDGVVEMFHEIVTKVKDPSITFCSASSYKQCLIVSAKINARLLELYKDEVAKKYFDGVAEKDLTSTADKAIFEKELNARTKLINPNIISFAGSYIVESNGCITFRPELESFNEKVLKACRELKYKPLIIYRTLEGDFYVDEGNIIKNKFNNIATVDIIKKYGIFATASNAEKMNEAAKNNQIMNYEIISLAARKELLEKLQKEVLPNTNQYLTPSLSYEISSIGKLGALKQVYKNLDDVVYVGDGSNDIPCLKNCGLSFAVGKKEKVTKEANYVAEKYSLITKVAIDGLTLLPETTQEK